MSQVFHFFFNFYLHNFCLRERNTVSNASIYNSVHIINRIELAWIMLRLGLDLIHIFLERNTRSVFFFAIIFLKYKFSSTVTAYVNSWWILELKHRILEYKPRQAFHVLTL